MLALAVAAGLQCSRARMQVAELPAGVCPHYGMNNLTSKTNSFGWQAFLL
jgi:hypothetical protein